jgi:hypothetical protein
LKAATGPNAPAIRYVYDGEGKRMHKTVGGLIAKRELKRMSRKTCGLSLGYSDHHDHEAGLQRLAK